MFNTSKSSREFYRLQLPGSQKLVLIRGSAELVKCSLSSVLCFLSSVSSFFLETIKKRVSLRTKEREKVLAGEGVGSDTHSLRLVLVGSIGDHASLFEALLTPNFSNSTESVGSDMGKCT